MISVMTGVLASVVWICFIVSAFISEGSAEGEIMLKANVSLQGDICPAGVQFNCTAQNVEQLTWFLGDNLLTTIKKFKKNISNLCDGNHYYTSTILEEFCEQGGCLSVQIYKRDKNVYNISSTLVTTGTSIKRMNYDNVSCTDGSDYSSSVSTDFNMTCGPVSLNLTTNISHIDDGGECEGGVEFICEGSDLPGIQWTYNDDLPLTENVTCSSSQGPISTYQSKVTDVNCSLTWINKNDSSAERCNFMTVCRTNLDSLRSNNVSSIGCRSSEKNETIRITCKAPSSTTGTHTTTEPITTGTASFSTTGTQTTVEPITTGNFYPFNFLPICHGYSSRTFFEKEKCTLGVMGFIASSVIILICFICCCPVFKIHHQCQQKKMNENTALLKKKKEHNLMQLWPSLCTYIVLRMGETRDRTQQSFSEATVENYGSLQEPPDMQMRGGLTKQPNSFDNLQQKKSPSEGKLLPVKQEKSPQYSRKSEHPKPPVKPPSSKSSQELDQMTQSQLFSHTEAPSLPGAPISSKTPDSPKTSDPPKPDQPKKLDSSDPPDSSNPPDPSEPLAPPDPKVNMERVLQENKDKDLAYKFSKKAFSDYHFKDLEDLGSRLQKFWYLRTRKDDKQKMLQITVKESQKCPLHLGDSELAVLRELLECLQHPYLLNIHEVLCSENGFITFLVDCVEEGSLRDKLYQVNNPLEDWCEKYKPGERPPNLPGSTIAICGRHILEALLLLYELGFPTIGQIHAGNVFYHNGRFVLGGYENCLLGYRSSIYSDLSRLELLNCMDLVMFGLMIYALATGEQMDHNRLHDYDFEEVQEKEVRKVLQFIFSEDLRDTGDQAKTISKILNHRFFKSEEKIVEFPIELSEDGLELLSVIEAVQSGQSKEIFRVTCLNMKEVVDAVNQDISDTYTLISIYDNIGWRNGKGWARVENSQHVEGLLTAIEVPHTCPIFIESTLDSIQALLKYSCNHLLTIYDVHYLKLGPKKILVLFQQFCEDGSMKDKIHTKSPLEPWKEKYKDKGRKLSDDDLAKIGREIINIAFRVSVIDCQNPLKLRFLHSGNIFWENNTCLIGGMENMLLGCRPRNYMKFRNYLSRIDTVMFGHLIFELASGVELSGAIPTDKEYKLLSAPVKDVLKNIFGSTTMELREIVNLGFFKPQLQMKYTLPRFTKGDVKLLLEKVRKEKKRDQGDFAGRWKYSLMERPIRKLKEKIQRHKRKNTTTPTITTVSKKSDPSLDHS